MGKSTLNQFEQRMIIIFVIACLILFACWPTMWLATAPLCHRICVLLLILEQRA